MTEKECLEICKELWTWMRDNKKTDYSNKHEHPMVAGGFWNFACSCPCCEYNQKINIIKSHSEKCHYCPLRKQWGEIDEEMGNIPCIHSPTSPYLPFEEGKGTPDLADQIVKFCEQRLRETA